MPSGAPRPFIYALFRRTEGKRKDGLYLQEIQIGESFWARFHFYKFWDDVKHYLRMGWYKESHFRNYAQDLEAAMDKCAY